MLNKNSAREEYKGRILRERIAAGQKCYEEKRSAEKNSEGEHRIKEVDAFKGFLIFAVVFGHFLLPLKDSPYSFFGRSFYLIYSFHMPAFLFLSGYFRQKSKRKKGAKLRSLLSYLLLYLFMKVFLHFSDILFYGEQDLFPDFWHESSTPWFMLVLFFLELTLTPLDFLQEKNTKLFKQDSKRDDFLFVYLFFLMILFIPLSFSPIGHKVKDFLALDRFLSFGPFFYLGMISGESHFSFQKIPKLPCFLGGIFAISLFLFLPHVYPYTRVFYGTWGYRIEREAILPFFKAYAVLLRIGFIPFSLCIASFFYHLIVLFLKRGSGKLSSSLSSFLVKMGKYTMPIYVFHRPFRDAFFASGAGGFVLLGRGNMAQALLFYFCLLFLSALLLFLLARDSLNLFCRFRFWGK